VKLVPKTGGPIRFACISTDRVSGMGDKLYGGPPIPIDSRGELRGDPQELRIILDRQRSTLAGSR